MGNGRVIGNLTFHCDLIRTIVLTIGYEAMIVGFWFIDHGCVIWCQLAGGSVLRFCAM